MESNTLWRSREGNLVLPPEERRDTGSTSRFSFKPKERRDVFIFLLRLRSQ